MITDDIVGLCLKRTSVLSTSTSWSWMENKFGVWSMHKYPWTNQRCSRGANSLDLGFLSALKSAVEISFVPGAASWRRSEYLIALEDIKYEKANSFLQSYSTTAVTLLTRHYWFCDDEVSALDWIHFSRLAGNCAIHNWKTDMGNNWFHVCLWRLLHDGWVQHFCWCWLTCPRIRTKAIFELPNNTSQLTA